jgi:hypothetical protein
VKNGNKQRNKKREYAKGLRESLKESICSECGEYGKHFVPPSLGEQGFFICQVPAVVETDARSS